MSSHRVVPKVLVPKLVRASSSMPPAMLTAMPYMFSSPSACHSAASAADMYVATVSRATLTEPGHCSAKHLVKPFVTQSMQ